MTTMKLSPTELGSADTIRAEADDKYQRIRSNPDLSDSAKQRQIAVVFNAANKQMTALQTQQAAAREAVTKQLTRAAFGVPTDPAGALSYRDACDRADKLDDVNSARALLTRAEHTGDVLLAQAVAQRAADAGWEEIVSAYAASRPAVAEAVGQLQQLQAEQQKPNWTNLFGYIQPKPAELDSMHDFQIEQLAADETSA